MKALAFSNNDIAVIAWTYDQRLPGCLGFAIYRCASDGSRPVALPAMARFKQTPKSAKILTTKNAPVQKFWWKDLTAERHVAYKYRIVPMGGPPASPTPLKGVQALETNVVTLTEKRGLFNAYFNRGIVACQAVSEALGGKLSPQALEARVANPNDKARKMLMGQLFEGVTSLLDQADNEGGTVRAALYELIDPLGLEVRLQAKDHGKPKSRKVILGNEVGDDKKTKKPTEDVCHPARVALKAAGVPVQDRILKKGQIPHNKFMVLFKGAQPVSVLTGSTNWTSTGLCTQVNNTLVIKSPKVASAFVDYWNRIQADTKSANGDQKKLQGPKFRSANRSENQKAIAKPIKLEDGSASISPLFSPSTTGLLPKKTPPAPTDMGELARLVKGAKHAVLFLCFDPGNNSILDLAGDALRANPNLFVRGALTSSQRAGNFKKALTGQDGKKIRADKNAFQVSVVGEPGGTKAAKAAKGAKGKKPPPDVDYRAIPAGEITKGDKFGDFEAEMHKVGFAIIHDKIVVIDPFTKDCVVVVGSHNLGFRASHNNDENMVIIRGHQELAEAYACHVLDIYDHYAFRYWLKKYPDMFGRPLDDQDTWQDRYIKDAQEKSPELSFWLSASPSKIPGA